MQNDVGLELLAKYLANECSNSEKKVVHNWIESDPVNRDEFNYIKSIWNASADKPVNWDVEKAWDKFSIKSGIKKYQSAEQTKKKQFSSYFTVSKLVPAFSIILILTAAVLYFNMLGTKPFPVNNINSVNAFHKINTEKGQRVSFKLPDGSEVFLNSASSIIFPISFNKSKREVFLEGEAYFKVVHKENEPFAVYFKDAIVEDIGTEFNIRAWNDDNTSSVAVSSGKVIVKAYEVDNSVFLTTGQFTTISENGLLSTPANVSVEHLTGWIKGRLYFDNSTLNNIFKNLGRSYNLNCTISDSSLLSLHLSAVFGDESQEEIINIISLALGLKHKKLSDKIYFYPGKNFYSKMKELREVQDLN